VTVEPSTEDLPFLLVHGPLVWKAVLAALVAGALVLLWALRPRTARRWPIWTYIIAAAVTGGAGAAAMVGIGKWPMSTCWRASFDVAARALEADRPELSNASSCALAAATPGNWPRALESAVRFLDRHATRDERSLRQLLAASWLRVGCEERNHFDGTELTAAAHLVHRGRFDEAARRARECADRRYQHIALVAAGRFAEAAAIRVPATDKLPALPYAETLIAAGRWAEAAAALDAQRRKGDRCIAELLRHHGGDARATARLRELADRSMDRACVVARSEIEPLDERRRLLLRSERAWGLAPFRWAAGAPDQGDLSDLRSAEQLLAQPEEASAVHHLPWLAASARAALPADARPAQRSNVLRWLAVAQLLDGDRATAAVTARQAADLAAPLAGQQRALRDARFLPALVELYTSATTKLELSPPSPERFDPRRLLLRRGEPFDSTPNIDEDKTAALATAQRGDGRPLARLLLKERIVTSPRIDGDLLAVLPRMTVGQDAVTRYLVWFRDMHDHWAWHTPLTYRAVRAFQRREVLRMAGATPEAARWDAVYRRHDQVLDDRRKLIPLVLLGGPR
jgi:hypothetical protein